MTDKSPPKEKLAELEAKAVAEATASADESFAPSPSLLNHEKPEALMEQVDGPSLENYEGKESVYVGKSVPVALRSRLEVPIHVTAPGSVVEYSMETKGYDIVFGITAEREEGVTMVKDAARVASNKAAITGKFLVGTVPCVLKFDFDNSFSMFREKLLSYRITVTPPGVKTIIEGRRRRSKACHKLVVADLTTVEEKYKTVALEKKEIEAKIAELNKELHEAKLKLDTVGTEEASLRTRVELRQSQSKLLDERLTKGWKDEPVEAGQ